MAGVLERRMGTTDTVLAIFAAVSERLRAENPGTIGISRDDVYDGFRELKRNNSGNEALQWIDFERTGDAWCSQALYNFFFFGGAFGPIQETRVSASVGYQIPHESSVRTKERIGREYGQEAIGEIERMASDFMASIKKTKTAA